MKQLNFTGTIDGTTYFRRYLISLLVTIVPVAVAVINESWEILLLGIPGVIYILSTQIKRYRALLQGANPWLAFWGIIFFRAVFYGYEWVVVIIDIVILFILTFMNSYETHQEETNK